MSAARTRPGPRAGRRPGRRAPGPRGALQVIEVYRGYYGAKKLSNRLGHNPLAQHLSS